MKRIIVALLTLALLLCGAASFAEGDEAAEAAIRCGIENGSYVIRIPDVEGDLGWVADDMSQDDSVVVLASAELVDGEFVVRYDPVGDGEVTVCVGHYRGIACDEMHTWDLAVRDGAVQECTGGSYTASSEEAELDPYLSGEWLEDESETVRLVIVKGEERGWDVEICDMGADNAYVSARPFTLIAP